MVSVVVPVVPTAEMPTLSLHCDSLVLKKSEDERLLLAHENSWGLSACSAPVANCWGRQKDTFWEGQER